MHMLYFSAPWCGPCKAMRPLIEALPTDDEFQVVHVNVDDDPSLTARHGVRTIPTLLLINEDGLVVRRHVGVMTAQGLQQFTGRS